MIWPIFLLLLHAFGIHGYEKFENLIPENLYKLTKDGHANCIAIKQGIEDYSDAISTHNETSTFLNLVQNSKIFIDNTLLIGEVLRNIHNRHELIIGPKKWGKSINLDMIKTFLQLHVDEQGNETLKNSTAAYKLFVNSEIVTDDGRVEKLQEPLLITNVGDVVSKIQGSYPVIHLSFKDVSGANYSAIKNQMRIAISRAFQQHEYMVNIMQKELRETIKGWYQIKDPDTFQLYLNNSDTVEIEESLSFLCKLLDHQFKKLIFILVDDYDTPLHSVLQYGKFPEEDIDKTFQLIMELMQSVLKKDCKTHRGIITGTFALDNQDGKYDWVHPDQGEYIANVEERFHEYFGFRHQLAKDLLQKANIDNTLSHQASEWYDGYKSHQHFYQTSSIVYFLKHQQIESYQGEHWAGEFIRKILRLQPEYRTSIVSHLSHQPTPVSPRFSLGNQTIRELKQLSISHRHDHQEISERVSNYLLGLGYLTRISDKLAKIPNYEISYEIGNWTMAYYIQHYRIDTKYIQDAANDLHRVIKDETNSVFLLQETLTQVFKHTFENTKSKEKISKDIMIRSIFNTVVLQLQRSTKFLIDAYYNKILSADVVLLENEIRRVVIVEMAFTNTAPEKSLETAESYQHVVKNFTDIESVQFIGIHISLKKAAWLLTKSVFFVTNSTRTTTLATTTTKETTTKMTTVTEATIPPKGGNKGRGAGAGKGGAAGGGKGGAAGGGKGGAAGGGKGGAAAAGKGKGPPK